MKPRFAFVPVMRSNMREKLHLYPQHYFANPIFESSFINRAFSFILQQSLWISSYSRTHCRTQWQSMWILYAGNGYEYVQVRSIVLQSSLQFTNPTSPAGVSAGGTNQGVNTRSEKNWWVMCETPAKNIIWQTAIVRNMKFQFPTCQRAYSALRNQGNH